jgi:predicted NBD/HSP70 family sugar kinase
MNDRLKARDRRIADRIEREEVDVAKRIEARFADVERRQLESLQRATDQAAGRFAEAAALQFDAAVKSAREEAARRLARELDRAVHMFAREAESVLAERLAQVADSGAQRVEKRLSQVTAGLERQRDDFIGALHHRLSQLELELRERIRSIAEDAESERAVLDRRLQELVRRADETLSARR